MYKYNTIIRAGRSITFFIIIIYSAADKSNDFQNFISSINKQETNKYHLIKFVRCSDWWFQSIFGRYLIRKKLDFGRFFS